VKKLREVVAALEKKCDLLQESSQNGKGKTSVVDNLLQGIASPFTERIVAMRLPDKFKVPSIPIFTGKEDPTEHWINTKPILISMAHLMRWLVELFP
jgi:hypothetical protein